MFIGTVPSISALRNVPIPTGTDTPIVRVQGFSTPGDGGGGDFLWDTSGVYVVDDNIGIVITSNVSGGGRWRRDGWLHFHSPRTQDVNPTHEGINVKWFGAKGDGNTDDTVAIQNAVNTASLISQTLSQLPTAFIRVGLFPACVQVTVPAGVYNLSGTLNGVCGVEIPGGIDLVGEGHAVLQDITNTYSLIRISTWTTVRGITFRGGSHHIALYGWNPVTGQLWDPTVFGNMPVIVDQCNFAFSTGPSIWHDPGPVPTLASGMNDLVLPQGTITVNSTKGYNSGGGQIAIFLTDGTQQTLNYTGISGNSFTGCSGGTGTLHTGDAVVNPLMWRSFQGTLRVTNFTFTGPHFFWGTGDSVIFSNGHIAWDTTTPVTSSDGYPLGIWNSADNLFLNNITAFGGGISPFQLPRQAIIVGTGLMNISNTTWAQNDQLCFIRQRVQANRYSGSGGAPVPMPGITVGPSVAPGTEIVLNNNDLICSFGAFWLECYEAFPASVKMKNWGGGDIFANTFGIWLDQGVNLTELQNRHTIDGEMEFDGFQDGFSYFRVWQGFDPGASALPLAAQSTEKTDAVRMYRLEPLWETDFSYSENLFQYPSTTWTDFAGGLEPGNTFSTDTSTGYPVEIATCNTNGIMQWSLNPIPVTDLLPSNAPAGTYCFSMYVKSNFSSDVWFLAHPTSDGLTNGVRKVEASDSWQRVWIPFYYPGNNSAFYLNFVGYPNASACLVQAWSAGTFAQQTRVTNGGNVYLCVVGGTSVSGPSGTGGFFTDGGTAQWSYVGPGGTFTPFVGAGLFMVNKGRSPAPYVFPANNDSATTIGWVPRTYYGTAAPTSGSYRVGDQVINTVPTAGGNIGWVCTTAGTPGTWKAFGTIAS